MNLQRCGTRKKKSVTVSTSDLTLLSLAKAYIPQESTINMLTKKLKIVQAIPN